MDLRLALNHSLADLRITLNIDIATAGPFLPSSNISGGSPVPIIFDRRLCVCEWGIPNGPRKPTILLPMSSFAFPVLGLRPCLVPLDGVYLHDDWSDRVFFVHGTRPGLVFAAAGLSAAGQFAILTRQSRPPPDDELIEFPVLLAPAARSISTFGIEGSPISPVQSKLNQGTWTRLRDRE
jgi:hypothetical protein